MRPALCSLSLPAHTAMADSVPAHNAVADSVKLKLTSQRAQGWSAPRPGWRAPRWPRRDCLVTRTRPVWMSCAQRLQRPRLHSQRHCRQQRQHRQQRRAWTACTLQPCQSLRCSSSRQLQSRGQTPRQTLHRLVQRRLLRRWRCAVRVCAFRRGCRAWAGEWQGCVMKQARSLPVLLVAQTVGSHRSAEADLTASCICQGLGTDSSRSSAGSVLTLPVNGTDCGCGLDCRSSLSLTAANCTGSTLSEAGR